MTTSLLALSPDVAAARLRSRNFLVRQQGAGDKWVVRQEGSDRRLTLSAADLSLAAHLAQQADRLTIDDLLTQLEAATEEEAPAVLAVVEPADGVVMMSEVEARQCVAEIREALENVRKRVWELHEREGWRALGYASWRACVMAEFEQSQAHLYRLLTAAEIEQQIAPDSPIGEIPESHLRPLAAIPPEQRPAAFERANELAGDGPRKAAHVEQAAAEIKALKDAVQRFAALGWKLERHGLWYKLSDPDGEHYATTPDLEPQMRTLAFFEDAARKRAEQAAERPAPAPVCSDCGASGDITQSAPHMPALCVDCREKRGIPTTRGLSGRAIAAGWTIRWTAGQWQAQVVGMARGWYPEYEEAVAGIERAMGKWLPGSIADSRESHAGADSLDPPPIGLSAIARAAEQPAALAEPCVLSPDLASRLKRLGGSYAGSDRSESGLVIHTIGWITDDGTRLQQRLDAALLAALIAEREADPTLAARAFVIAEDARTARMDKHVYVSLTEYRRALDHIRTLLAQGAR